MREVGLDQPVAGHRAVIADCLIVPAVVERAERGGRLIEKRRAALRTVEAGGRIAEERDVEPIAGIQLDGAFRRVGHAVSDAIDAAQTEQRKVLRRLQRSYVTRRIDRAEEERFVLEQR